MTATPGAPTTVTVNPDGSATASGSFSLTSKDQGQTLTADIGIKSSSTGTLDMDIGLSFDGGAGKTVRVGFGGRINSGPGTTCPSATGEVRLDSRVTGKSGSSEKFGAKRVNLGTVHEATTVTMRSGARAQMGPDARLQPFTFSAGADFDYARSAQVLGFFSSRTPRWAPRP